jgi:VWFA-related protein
MRKYCFIVVFAAGILVSALAQEPKPAVGSQSGSQEPDVVRISVNLVQVDGTVTDKDGRQVTDLNKEDFELFIDGRRQDISNFSYIPSQPKAAPGTKRAGKSDAPAPPAPPLRLRPEQVRRTVALVIGNVSYEGLQDVKKALRKFVDEQMQPGDLVAIVRLAQGGILQQFTNDKRLLHLAIDGVRWNPITGTEVTAVPQAGNTGPSTDADAAQATTAADDFFEDLIASNGIQQLNLIVRGLESLPGRKSVIFFSDGFQLFGKDLENRRTLEAVQRVTDRATRALVVFYTIDSRGLQSLMTDASANMNQLPPIGTSLKVQPTLTGPDFAAARQNRVKNFLLAQDGLAYLADQTGGRFMQSTDLSGAISRTLDQKGYYLIGYRPDETTFKLDAGRRRPYHRIEIKVKRPELRAHFRKGFYGSPDKQSPQTPSTSVQRILAALISPFDTSDINLRLTSLFGHDKQDGSFVRTLLHIDVSDLTFTVEPDGRRKAVMNVLAATFTENGLVDEPVARQQTVRVRPESMEQVKRDGVVYEMTMPVKSTGIYQVRVAVQDAESERIGSASQFSEVPDLGKSRLALSGIVLSAKMTPPGNGTGPGPQTANSEDNQIAGNEILASPAVRRFRRGMQMNYAFLVLNARPDPVTGRPQVETQVVLYRDGRPVFRGALRPINSVGQDPNELRSIGSLNLGTDLSPGEYVLQVVVTDKLAKEKKYQMATQWIDFDLIG